MTAGETFHFSWLQRLLMLFVPDSAATSTGIGIVVTAFLLGILEMFDRQFDAAEDSFYLAIGMLVFLMAMKYMALRANILAAQYSHSLLLKHIKQLNNAVQNPDSSTPDYQSRKEEAAQERAEMVETMGVLKEAIKHIQAGAPIRPKYEATIEMMERALRRG